MIIAIVQSTTNKQWGYCPKAALPVIGHAMRYSDDAGFDTAEQAIEQARRDKSIPQGSTFEVQP